MPPRKSTMQESGRLEVFTQQVPPAYGVQAELQRPLLSGLPWQRNLGMHRLSLPQLRAS
jgi:hypothetical protein